MPPRLLKAKMGKHILGTSLDNNPIGGVSVTNQKHQEVLDLYHALGINDVENVNTVFSTGQINGRVLIGQHLVEEQLAEGQNGYSSRSEQ